MWQPRLGGGRGGWMRKATPSPVVPTAAPTTTSRTATLVLDGLGVSSAVVAADAGWQQAIVTALASVLGLLSGQVLFVSSTDSAAGNLQGGLGKL